MKFFLKWRVVSFFERGLLALFGARVNKDGWEDRVLIVDLHGIGDVIMATPALRYYREHFHGKKIYLLVARRSGMAKEMFGGEIDELLTLDVATFGVNPFSAIREINRLRRIGFATVINECLSIKEKAGRVMSVSLGAESVAGYEGPGIELANPGSAPYRRFADRHIFPRYTTLVPPHPSSAIAQHLAIVSAVTGKHDFPDVSTIFSVNGSAPRPVEGKYVIFVPGVNQPARRWELAKVAEVAAFVHAQGFGVVVVGSPAEHTLGDQLGLPFLFVNAAGTLSLMETAAAIKGAYCVITNDTGPVHIAIALGVPSICVVGGAHLYMNSFYGRAGINRWVFGDAGCRYDDWQCTAGTAPGAPAPCIAAVTTEDVIREFTSLGQYLSGHHKMPLFEAQFAGEHAAEFLLPLLKKKEPAIAEFDRYLAGWTALRARVRRFSYAVRKYGAKGFLYISWFFPFIKKVRAFWGGDICVNLPENIGIALIGSFPGFELPVTKFLIKNLNSESVFYDVGAHIGFYTTLAQQVVATGEVHSFEPNPSTFAVLAKNARAEYVHINKVAVTDAPGEKKFYADLRRMSGLSGFRPNPRLSEITVRTTTLDEYAATHRPPTIMKVDVEGEEEAIVRGAARLLREANPVIIMEIWKDAASGNATQSPVVDIFHGMGYVLYGIDREGDLHPLANADQGRNLSFDNFVFKR